VDRFKAADSPYRVGCSRHGSRSRRLLPLYTALALTLKREWTRSNVLKSCAEYHVLLTMVHHSGAPVLISSTVARLSRAHLWIRSHPPLVPGRGRASTSIAKALLGGTFSFQRRVPSKVSAKKRTRLLGVELNEPESDQDQRLLVRTPQQRSTASSMASQGLQRGYTGAGAACIATMGFSTT
jgi:hypothetical protein